MNNASEQQPAIVMGAAIENAHSAPCEERAAPLASNGPDENRTASVGGASAQVQGDARTPFTGPKEGCEHDWRIWPETDGQEQRCWKCGSYRRTPEEDKFWVGSADSTRGASK